jgi:antitoxin ParD1/3/4
MARQSTLNVSLTPALQQYVKSKLDRGGYESASEVVREGLRALQEREQDSARFWSGVRSKVAVARSQIAKGETVDGESAMEGIISELKPATARKARSRRR